VILSYFKVNRNPNLNAGKGDKVYRENIIGGGTKQDIIKSKNLGFI
jgi:hypothetical protein